MIKKEIHQPARPRGKYQVQGEGESPTARMRRTAVKYLCRMTSHFCIIPSVYTRIRCGKSIMHAGRTGGTGGGERRQGGRTVTEATVITRKMVVLVEPD